MLILTSTSLTAINGVPGSGGAVDRYLAPVGVTTSAVCAPFSSPVVTRQPGASLACCTVRTRPTHWWHWSARHGCTVWRDRDAESAHHSTGCDRCGPAGR